MKTLQDVLALQDERHKLEYILYPSKTVEGLPGMIYGRAVFSIYEWTSDSGEEYWSDTQNLFQNRDEDQEWLVQNGWKRVAFGYWYKYEREVENG